MKELVTLLPSIDEEDLKVVVSESLIVISLIILILFSWVLWTLLCFFPYFGFSTLISCVPGFLRVLSLVFLPVHIYLDLCTRVHTRVNWLLPVTILTVSSSQFGGCEAQIKVDRGQSDAQDYV